MTLSQKNPSLPDLPQVFAIALSGTNAITLSGEEKTKYLQGQVTCDVDAMAENGVSFGAHCDAKGKMFSLFRLFNYKDKHLLLMPSAVAGASLKELQKFGVFAKTDITLEQELGIFALAGEHAANWLTAAFGDIPNPQNQNITFDDFNIVYVKGAIPRFVLVGRKDKLQKLFENADIPLYGQSVWHMLEILDGVPVMSEPAISKYVPQMLNVQAIGGISFTKGCYLGQETVARMKYLGRNKKPCIPWRHRVINWLI